MKFTSFIMKCCKVLKLRSSNRHNSLHEFNFTKIPAFTIQLPVFEVFKEVILFRKFPKLIKTLKQIMDITK